MSEFVHLHNHTHYSLLDSITTVDELVAEAKNDNQHAIALTDHGVMFGLIEFYKKCKSKNIKPILGVEAYMANGSRFERSNRKDKKNYYHVILLAKKVTGYKNIMRMTSLANIEGFHYKPRIDEELLNEYHEGVICTSACMGGVVSSHVVDGNYNLAYETAEKYKNLFGDDFYLEIQNHFLKNDPLILEQVPDIAKKLGIKLVATNDVHYAKKEQALAHNALLHIRDYSANEDMDINILKYGVDEYYVKSQLEMKSLFSAFPDALQNTLEIADKCDVELDMKTNHMPIFNIPFESKAKDLDEYLTELVYEGLQKRFEVITQKLKERVDYELSVIIKMGFPGYFLVVADFIRAAREMGVRVGPGRGSAAGSLVAYALWIVDVDPLKYDLLFERFLNPDRVSMPDIDVDFSDDKRELVIDYVKEKYGKESIAMISTFGKLTSKAAITDVGRILKVPLELVKEITKKIPVKLGVVTPMKEVITLPELKQYVESNDPKLKLLFDLATKLEKRNRNNGMHAAGVVIAPGNMLDYVPLVKAPKETNIYTTQYTMKDLEDIGLIKMDFLGLKTLRILDDAVTMIKENTGIFIDIDNLDLFDEKTYNLIGEGNTLAIFQFESNGMQEYLKKMKPKSIDDLAAMNALYRPGPMGNIPEFLERRAGTKPVVYIHPIMEESLKNTFGIIVYQEQVMRLAQDIGGYTLSQADLLRRAMGKKDAYQMENVIKPELIKRMAEKGVDSKVANEITELIVKFADYGFNKSHAVVYSYIAYQTAFLKANYPAEFLAATMSAELNNQAKIVELKDEAKKMGVKLFPPDINKSGTSFIALNNQIYFGLAAIKNVGILAVESIVKARENGDFKGFFDFCARVEIRLVNRRALEALICSGAFDGLADNGHRAAYMLAIDSALDYSKSMSEGHNSSMDSLFAGGEETSFTEPQLPEIPIWTDEYRLEKENEYLNYYVTGHPLMKYEAHIASLSSVTTKNFNGVKTDDPVSYCGIITDLRTRIDKNKKTIGFITIEDFTGKAECIFWSKAWEENEKYIIKNSIVYIYGKVKDVPEIKEVENLIDESEDSQEKDEILKIVVDYIEPIEKVVNEFCKGFKIWINEDDKDLISKLEELSKIQLLTKGAKSNLIINLKQNSGQKILIYEAEKANIIPNSENTIKLMDIFGNNSIRLLMNRMERNDKLDKRQAWKKK